jgi:hypothetical protein
MPFIRETCPICGGRLTLVHIECQDCHTQLTGSTATLAAPPPATGDDPAKYGPLARLSREQLDFVVTFLRARGIIKTAEGMLGMSYPAVRNRLDDIVAALGVPPSVEGVSGDMRREQRDILADLAEGRITPAEAHAELRRVRESAITNQSKGEATDDSTA